MSLTTKGLEELVKKFDPATNVRDVVKITDVQPVASYSWIEANSPTIAIPGSPPIWKNSNPKRVPADSGLVYIDQNSARMATKSPLTPIFAAVDSLGGYNYASLDLVSDRNNLRKLLRWATGVAGEKDFRIDVERAGKTCLFTRREDKDSEYVVGFKGFGHEYEKAATRLAGGCEKATGHHRIVSIDFGGLKILLRFEVDACTGSIDVDELTSSFSRLATAATAATASTAESPSPPTPVSGIACLETNPRKLVPQSSLIELKTRAAHRELDWHEAYPQLYLSQTAYLYLAKHQKGSFVTVEKVELGGAGMRRYASEAEAGMGKLREVLKEVLEAVRKEGHGVPLSLVCQGGRLALHKRQAGTGKVVGNEILSRFG